MQNFIKSQTRLAFVQYIFQSLILDINTIESNRDFQENFYDVNIINQVENWQGTGKVFEYYRREVDPEKLYKKDSKDTTIL